MRNTTQQHGICNNIEFRQLYKEPDRGVVLRLQEFQGFGLYKGS